MVKGIMYLYPMPTPDSSLKKSKTPWPTQQAMQQIYQKQLWGAGATPFYSGEGSHQAHIVWPYVAAVKDFLASQPSLPSICDLGCGDFNIGKCFVPLVQNYIGVDIVPELIAYLKTTCATSDTTFLCKDLANDELPQANIALLRQVLQHLSNLEIDSILKKLSQYQYVIITEHLPAGAFEPNVDIISGQGTRLKKKSGVLVHRAPFYFTYKQSQLLSEVCLDQNKGIIQTIVYTVF